ncbi:MAG: energy transducer TonB [Pyrinomonadaceae bacterium]|nr:energy transducer TonB [Pyrinomonadaceae bacterium]
MTESSSMKAVRASCRIACAIFILHLLATSFKGDVFAAAFVEQPKVAVLDFGDTETGRRFAAKLTKLLMKDAAQLILDQAQSRAAAFGNGYRGSLNMSLSEARDLGAAIGCDFFIIGNAQTLRRSSSANPVYYQSTAAVFFVNAHNGKLLFSERLNAEAPTHEATEANLLNEINERFALKFPVAIRRALEDEELRKRKSEEALQTFFEDAPEDDSPAAKDFRPPQPFRRLRPRYTDEAARFEVEAVVDVSVEVDAEGEVANVEIVRWAGFGLDESVVETIRQLHFRPATRAGRAVPVRVLLRYNFRRPSKDNATAHSPS